METSFDSLNHILDNALSVRLCDFLRMKSTDEFMSKLCEDLHDFDFDSLTDVHCKELCSNMTKWCNNLYDLRCKLRMLGLIVDKRRYNRNVAEGGDVIDGF